MLVTKGLAKVSSTQVAILPGEAGKKVLLEACDVYVPGDDFDKSPLHHLYPFFRRPRSFDVRDLSRIVPLIPRTKGRPRSRSDQRGAKTGRSVRRDTVSEASKRTPCGRMEGNLPWGFHPHDAVPKQGPYQPLTVARHELTTVPFKKRCC